MVIGWCFLGKRRDALPSNGMSDWETIVNHFESTARCSHGNRPHVSYDPGCIVCDTNGNCKCESHDGDGLTLTQFLAEWQSKFGK